MANTTKRSVIIDLPTNEPPKKNSNAIFIIAFLLMATIGAGAFYYYQTTYPTSKLVEEDATNAASKQALPSIEQAEVALPVEVAKPEPIQVATPTPAPVTQAEPTIRIPAAPITVESELVIEPKPIIESAPVAVEPPKRNYDDITAILTIAQPLIQSSTDTQNISRLQAIDLQLKQSRKQQQSPSAIQLLENTYAKQLAQFAYTELNEPLELATVTIHERDLETYAAVEWSIFHESHLEAQALHEDEQYLESLYALIDTQIALNKFNQTAINILQTMAKNTEQAGNIEAAKINYENILHLDSANQSALSFLHQHAYAPGTTIDDPSGITLAFLPAGNFTRGSPSNEFQRDEDENKHSVSLSKSIYISTTEVTQAQWKAVMGSMPQQFPPDGSNVSPNQPVHSLNWHEVDAFCKRLNQLNPDAVYRLPTEAEWEYACRAGTSTAYNNQKGQLSIKDANTFNPSNPANHDYAIEVASYPPNQWGLYDMHGNLWEWTSDWKGDYPTQNTTDPQGATDKLARDLDLQMKVLRGGSYYDEPNMARSANRWESAPSIAADYIGFRIVRESTF